MMPARLAADAINALFEQGLQQYRQGALERADEILENLLQRDPGHFDALHLAGLVAARRGTPQLAVERIQRAIDLNGTVPAAHRHLGNALCAAGRSEEALGSYARAIELRPEFREAHVNRAMTLLTLRRPAEALLDFAEAIRLDADDAEVHAFRASALIDLQRPLEAVASCDVALARQSDHAVARVNRAAAACLLGRYAEALSDSDRALRSHGQFAEAHAYRGAALYALRRLDEALASADAALALQPRSAFAANIRALCLLEMQQPQQALDSVDLAIASRPDLADAYNTRGLALADLRRFEESIDSFARSILRQPDNPEPSFNLGLRYLQAGEFGRGWELYERRPMPDRSGAANWLNRPRWDGSQELAGRTILTYSEQGLGDTIQFCRYARLLQERGARVILAVQESLRTLLRTLGPDIEIIGAGARAPEHDFHCPLLSLPRAFHTRLNDIPASVPYLQPDPRLVEKWRERLGTTDRSIGIRWQGSTGRADAGRSFALRHFEAIATIPGTRLMSLQKGAGSEQLSQLPAHWHVEDLGSDFEPGGEDAFLDMAAVMESLDLVVTSDTSIAHLAGALGRPAWVVLKWVPDWRWMLDRDESPWYPTLRLFRQDRPGDWDSAFGKLHAALLLRHQKAKLPA
jgi:tetratricopeptide (TPR) repeat protein